MARFRALDRLRALAVLSMVQGHTFTALLADDALPSAVMQVHALVHGLTAPAFLFGAGLAFGLATYPRYDLHHAGGRVLRARLRRYLLLIVLGYALQLPGASLLAALQLQRLELAPVLRVGPLHLVALSLSLCQLGALLARTPRMHALLALVLGLLVTALSPTVWASALGPHVGLVLGPWLDGASGSLFPIFPWASFVLFGVACAVALARPEAAPTRARLWLLLGLALALGAYGTFALGVRLSEPRWFWQASPLNVCFRLGLVMGLLGLLHLRSGPRSASSQGAGLGVLLARHSLVAYVTHLLLLYGTPWTPNLQRRLGASLDAAEATLVFLGVLAVTLLVVRAWAWLHEERALQQGWVQVALTLLGLLLLIR